MNDLHAPPPSSLPAFTPGTTPPSSPPPVISMSPPEYHVTKMADGDDDDDEVEKTKMMAQLSLPARTALEFLSRDHRPTLMLHLHQTVMIPPHNPNLPRTLYTVLFKNKAFEDCPELNGPGIHQNFAEMQPRCVRIGRWIVEITRIGEVQLIAAFRSCWERRMRSDDLDEVRGEPLILCEDEHIHCAIHADWDKASVMREACGEATVKEDEDVDALWEVKKTESPNVTATMDEPPAVATGNNAGGVEKVSGSGPCGENNEALSPPNEAVPLIHGGDKDRRNQKMVRDWRVEPTTEEERGKEPLHFKNLRQVDWGNSAFGPMESWSPWLVSAALNVMYSPLPVVLYWGPNYEILYNEAWIKIGKGRDPQMLGQPFQKYWPELWSYFKPLLDGNFYEGVGARRDGEQLIFSPCENSPSGTGEERYFEFNMFPVMGGSFAPEGVVNFAIERTTEVVTSRRFETLSRLSNSLRAIQNFDDQFWRRLVTAFDNNPYDSPVLIVYRTASMKDDNVQHLQQAIGVTCGGQFAPYMCFVEDEAAGTTGRGGGIFNEEMRIAKNENIVVMKHLSPTSLELNEISPRGFDEPPSMAAVIPIQINKKSTCGFLILGLNPRRPVDQGYTQWIESIHRELAVSSSSVSMRQAEFSRAVERERQGAIKQLTLDLKEQLSRRTEALRRSELMFTQTAETLPVGICLTDHEGQVFYSNHAARVLLSVKSDTEMNDKFLLRVFEEDRQQAIDAIQGALKTKSSLNLEYRLGNDPDPALQQKWKYWVAASIIAQVDEFTGETSRFMVALVDITSHKLNEEYQRQLSTQALERRRQQENFIDIFSHELRNPFSATLQCADSILSSLAAYQSKEAPLDTDDVIDSAQTILVCVQHQMRIIDDVLTLSKLESMALTVVPTHLKVHESVAQMLKIFASELQAKGITVHYTIEDSYRDLIVEWVMADPSRFSQILVNLLTNSIKFTSLQSECREITVRLAVSKTRPDSHGDVVYHSSKDDHPHSNNNSTTSTTEDITTSADWGGGDPLYIQVMVSDTGIGISKAWQSKLFRRFEQVPKTHVTYGGSGLGLFICRRLCHVQGGEIGFVSNEGTGSAFAFFIKVRRSPGPSEESAATAAGLTYLGGPTTDFTTVLKPSPAPAYCVLIVEDNLINQEVLRRQLKNGGCITHVVNNGQQALDFIRASSFARHPTTSPPHKLDLVLMDMEMPIMDGNTATRHIRALETEGELAKHVPIMGISANARPEQVALMTAAGMDDAIPKPFRIPELMRRFGALMEQFKDDPTPNSSGSSSSSSSSSGGGGGGGDCGGSDCGGSGSSSSGSSSGGGGGGDCGGDCGGSDCGGGGDSGSSKMGKMDVEQEIEETTMPPAMVGSLGNSGMGARDVVSRSAAQSPKTFVRSPCLTRTTTPAVGVSTRKSGI